MKSKIRGDAQGSTSRRSFLVSTGGLVTAAWLGTQWAAITAAAHHAGDMAAADIAAAPAWTGFQFLTAAEAQDVEAITAQIVPSGAPTPGTSALGAPAAGASASVASAPGAPALGAPAPGTSAPGAVTPGAREAHAVYFIDRSLATYFAAWSADFRDGLGELRTKFHAAHAITFAAADGDTQIAFLGTVDRTPFFDTLRTLTLIGLFASPKYGGNTQGAGWTMIGFEDRHAFSPPFGYYDARYAGFVPYATTSA